MDKMLKTYDTEHMKMTMLKHEETFKQQVFELHRLYRIQKILMKSVKNNKAKRTKQQRLICDRETRLHQNNGSPRNLHQKTQPGFKLDRPIEKFIKETSGDKGSETEDESKIQLTLGPTSYNTRTKIEASNSETSFSSCSTSSSNNIKGTNSYRNQKNLASGLTIVVNDTNYGYHTKKNVYRVDDQSSQDRLNQPSWLLQALSLSIS